MMKDSQSYFLTDGEWKFTNLSIIEYVEELGDGEFSVVTYAVWQYFHVILYRFATKKKKKSISTLGTIAQHSKLSPAHLNFVCLLQQISMERQPTLYILNLILPTCALYLLDMAVLFGPSSLEDKISFQIAIILGSSMLAVILNNILPTSSNKPPVIGTHLH